jgi:AcrR family transcriptional regulator
MELARVGGPDAVVLREATRRAGVVPNAAYRHFADRGALLQAVCASAMAQLAQAMEAEQAAVHASDDAAATARGRFRAVGTGYLRWAQSEPGLFRTAFSSAADHADPKADPESAGASGLTPFQLLSAAIDDIDEAGLLAPGHRPDAEFLAWSAVHGLAMLVIDGPLRALDREHIDRLVQRLLDVIDAGL